MDQTGGKGKQAKSKRATSRPDSPPKASDQRSKVSEHRRQQNRIAQRTYRNRQKRRLEFLEQLVEVHQNRQLSIALGASQPPYQPPYPLESSQTVIPQQLYPETLQRPAETIDRQTNIPAVRQDFTFPTENVAPPFPDFTLSPGFFDQAEHAPDSFPIQSGDAEEVADISKTSYTDMLGGPTWTSAPSSSVAAPHFSTFGSHLFNPISMEMQSEPKASTIPDVGNTEMISFDLPSHTKMISVVVPGKKARLISPLDLKRYFSQLPMATRQQFLRLAMSKDFDFIGAVYSALETLSLGTIDMADSRSSSNSPAVSAQPSRGQIGISDWSQDQYVTKSFSASNLFSQTIRIERLSYFTAIFANASALGFDFSEFLDETSVSPLYKPNDVSSQASSGSSLSRQKDAVTISPNIRNYPKDLAPLPVQISTTHHPYLDVIPFPTFRQRAILAASTNPPLLDEDDFCIDLVLNEGLVCWGNGGHGLGAAKGKGGMNIGAP